MRSGADTPCGGPNHGFSSSRKAGVSPYFPGGLSEEHRAHVSIWWSELLGGPARYTEDLGGYEKMLAPHRGLAIAPEERHEPPRAA